MNKLVIYNSHFQCTENIHKLKFQLIRNVLPLYGTSYTTCIGCDTAFNEILNIKQDCIRQTERANAINNDRIRNTSSFTSTSSTSQLHTSQQRQQSVSNNIRSGQSNTIASSFGTSGGYAQNHSFNVSRPNRSNTVRESTASNNRENTTSWINTHNFNSSSDQPAPRKTHNVNNKTSVWGNIDNNAEIICNCHEIAIQLTVKKEGPNKGK